MKTILLTGCAGFIGCNTAFELLRSGNRVVGIDDLNDYYDVRLKRWRLKQLDAINNFYFIEGDIEDRASLAKLFSDFSIDAVINLAARAGVRYSIENPHIYLTTNAHGTLNLLECMKAHGTTKMVLASTSALYAGQKMPFKESLPVNSPISPYAASKKAAEVFAYTYHHLYGIDVTVNRFFTVYGPAGRPDMSPFRFVKWIDEGTPITLYGDGTQSRDFTFVEDIARGVVGSLMEVGYEVINLGGGRSPISINKMINTIEDLLGKKAVIDQRPFNKSDMMHTSADIEKAKSIIGWLPEVHFEDGIQKTVEWYLDNKSWVSDIQV